MDRTRQEELRTLAADLARKGIGQAAREADELLAAVPDLLDYVQALEAEREKVREAFELYEENAYWQDLVRVVREVVGVST